jgi:hypothetical protein
MKRLIFRRGNIKNSGLFLLAFVALILINACENFPTNPAKNSEQEMWVDISHVDTDYIATDVTVDGLAAEKVNKLLFEIKANNFEATALEVFGRVTMEGPPHDREHNLYFRTDKLLQMEDSSSSILNQVTSGTAFQLIRSKFPTNEYSPFTGIQGMVKSVVITNVIAHIDGEEVNIPFQ